MSFLAASATILLIITKGSLEYLVTFFEYFPSTCCYYVAVMQRVCSQCLHSKDATFPG